MTLRFSYWLYTTHPLKLWINLINRQLVSLSIYHNHKLPCCLILSKYIPRLFLEDQEYYHQCGPKIHVKPNTLLIFMGSVAQSVRFQNNAHISSTFIHLRFNHLWLSAQRCVTGSFVALVSSLNSSWVHHHKLDYSTCILLFYFLN